jgi:flavin-dependent dehydrogenase
MKTFDEYEAVIIGGGPAGSTAAAVLAQHGRRVLVLEKDQPGRYHVGESLLPFCYFPLKRIGLIEQMKASHFPKKFAVQFVTTEGKVATPFYFFQHMEHEASTTWQVLRSEFDQMLLDNARAKGADVWNHTEATGIIREGGRAHGVLARRQDGESVEVRTSATIDASGRDALTMKRNNWLKWDPQLQKVAIWTYFKGAKRDPGIDEGSTTIAYLPEKGWFWYIPLPDDVVGVGIVAEKEYLFDETKDLREIFCREVGKNAWIMDHLAPGQQFGEYRVTKEFSYRSQHCAEDGLVLVGDAFAFLDPVFSSGVYLALRSGELAGDTVHDALSKNDVSAAGFTPYSEQVRHEIEAMRKLVYAFYDESFSFGKLIRAYPDLRPDLTDCLIGNLQKDFTELFNAVGEFGAVPEPLPYGEPLGRSTQELVNG